MIAIRRRGCWIARLAVERDRLPATGARQYYWTDLEGLRIEHRDGTDLGRIAYLLETGANDVLVTTGDPERLIPFILGDVVLDVDLANGVVSGRVGAGLSVCKSQSSAFSRRWSGRSRITGLSDVQRSVSCCLCSAKIRVITRSMRTVRWTTGPTVAGRVWC